MWKDVLNRVWAVIGLLNHMVEERAIVVTEGKGGGVSGGSGGVGGRAVGAGSGGVLAK